jgi:hypothetical protein
MMKMECTLQGLEERSVELQQAVEYARDTVNAAQVAVAQAQANAQANGCNLSSDDLASVEAVCERSRQLCQHKVCCI